MAGDNRLTTENFLRLNFTPKSGVTAGTNDLLSMDCDQIKTRYNVDISGVSSTGLRLPSQNQITDASGTIISPETITYQLQQSAGSTTIGSIEISTNGVYLYLFYPSLQNIRRYTLSTPFDVSTMGAYQTFDYSFLGLSYITSGGLFLSPDQKKLSYLLGSTVVTTVLNVANDLTTELYTTSYNVSTITASLYYPKDISFDPSGHYASIVSKNSSGSLRVVLIQTSSPFEISGTVAYVSQAAFNTPVSVNAGFEFNGDGTRMYIMEAFNTSFLHSYNVSPVAYKPSNLSTPDLGGQNLGLGSLLSTDFCFSDDLKHLYVIGSINDSVHPIIYQFGME